MNNDINFSNKFISNALQRLLAQEKRHLQNLLSEKKKCKCGLLIIRNRCGRTYYSELVSGKERGITTDKARLERVLRSYELDRLISDADSNVRILEEALEKIYLADAIKIHPQLKKLDTCSNTYTATDKQWMNAPFIKNELFSERLEYHSDLGIAVRSKSELIIANLLEKYGIPYRYEQQLSLPSKTYYPDFTLKRHDGTIVLWEHFGLMGVGDYSEKAFEKIEEYRVAGYSQHTNLICTYEEDIKSREKLEHIVERFLLF